MDVVFFYPEISIILRKLCKVMITLLTKYFALSTNCIFSNYELINLKVVHTLQSERHMTSNKTNCSDHILRKLSTCMHHSETIKTHNQVNFGDKLHV